MPDNKILQSILNKVNSTDKKIKHGFKEVKEEISENRNRIDKLGLQLAELEDDAPTREEFDQLNQKVDKIESHQAPPN